MLSELELFLERDIGFIPFLYKSNPLSHNLDLNSIELIVSFFSGVRVSDFDADVYESLLEDIDVALSRLQILEGRDFNKRTYFKLSCSAHGASHKGFIKIAQS